jgi:hypothetical protein
VDVIKEPHNTFYGMREVIIRDLNGFGSRLDRKFEPRITRIYRIMTHKPYEIFLDCKYCPTRPGDISDEINAI